MPDEDEEEEDEEVEPSRVTAKIELVDGNLIQM